jgi:low affinity Fe/Cu permease
MGKRDSETASRFNGVETVKSTLSAKAMHAPAVHGNPHTGSHPNAFTRFAHTVARWAGKPAAFLIALTLIIVWAASGPIFGFSDTWQLVVNTATTIVTFLMVFLIQNTQNRDTLALQIKLADLIIAMRGTHNSMATAEDMSDEDLEALHEEYRKRAEQTEASLEQRRAGRAA